VLRRPADAGAHPEPCRKQCQPAADHGEVGESIEFEDAQCADP
jgi:hypothetical protein